MKKNKIISPYFENKVFAGVRVTLGNEDFVISPKDYRGGRKMPLLKAIDVIKANNLTSWDYRQICLTMAYRKEIDRMLEDNGGDKLNNFYWVSSMYSGLTYCYDGDFGILDYISYDDAYCIRPIKNLKKE